jgi:hypothetical protein
VPARAPLPDRQSLADGRPNGFQSGRSWFCPSPASERIVPPFCETHSAESLGFFGRLSLGQRRKVSNGWLTLSVFRHSRRPMNAPTHGRRLPYRARRARSGSWSLGREPPMGRAGGPQDPRTAESRVRVGRPTGAVRDAAGAKPHPTTTSSERDAPCPTHTKTTF